MTRKKSPSELKPPRSTVSKENRAATEKIVPLLTTTPQASSVIGALAGTSKKGHQQRLANPDVG